MKFKALNCFIGILILALICLAGCGGGGGSEPLVRNKSVDGRDIAGTKIGTFFVTQVFTEDRSTASISAKFKNESGKKVSFDYEILGDTSLLLFYNSWKYDGHLDSVLDGQTIDLGVISSSTIIIEGKSNNRLFGTLKNVAFSD